ncbi:MAG: TlpA disulfide reductase family protein [Prevotellaceae bacterium]|nr:TlpA family protein disulfide reductase [Prevotella sp.]MDD7257433.1 TlpA disulfide reductase family protein [Prevotellaceae bacterium]MDY6129988.1 TlpA disulfide reductase family protein [Prevotella sp.]
MKVKTMMIGLFAALSVWQASAQVEEQDADAKYATELLKKGMLAPDFNLRNPDGKMLNFRELAEGKYVVLDFWASWCPDCRRDIPHLQKMYQKFGGKGVEFIGVSFDTDKKIWKNAIRQYEIVYPQVSELKKLRETGIAKAYGIQWIPSMYLIGKDGKVLLATVLSEKLEKALTELFGE